MKENKKLETRNTGVVAENSAIQFVKGSIQHLEYLRNNME